MDSKSAAPGTNCTGDASGAPVPVGMVPPAPRRRVASIAFLLFGALVALYLGTQGPRQQHVRVVLGAAAPDVSSVDLQYVARDGELARDAHFIYRQGEAPRVVAHEPQLPNGEYHLEIDIDTRDGRRTVERQVTLGGGSTQIDVSTALMREDKPR